MVKSFKRFITEDIIKENFNSFVEGCFGGGQIDKDKAQAFVTEPDYTYNGDAYRLLWIPNQEIVNQKSFKNISRHISNKYLNNPDAYKFFYKTPDDAFNSKIYTKDIENKTGIIFKISAKNAIDLSKYTGTNEAIVSRVNDTKPVLTFEPMSINNIYGKITYDQYSKQGWEIITDDVEDNQDEDSNKEDHELKPGNKEKKDEEGTTNKVEGGKVQHSKFPHKGK